MSQIDLKLLKDNPLQAYNLLLNDSDLYENALYDALNALPYVHLGSEKCEGPQEDKEELFLVNTPEGSFNFKNEEEYENFERSKVWRKKIINDFMKDLSNRKPEAIQKLLKFVPLEVLVSYVNQETKKKSTKKEDSSKIVVTKRSEPDPDKGAYDIELYFNSGKSMSLPFGNKKDLYVYYMLSILTSKKEGFINAFFFDRKAEDITFSVFNWMYPNTKKDIEDWIDSFIYKKKLPDDDPFTDRPLVKKASQTCSDCNKKLSNAINDSKEDDGFLIQHKRRTIKNRAISCRYLKIKKENIILTPELDKLVDRIPPLRILTPIPPQKY